MKRSTAVNASVLAATIIPFMPIVVPPAATACHECEGVPGTQVAVRNPAVGTTQLTSATSVEPPLRFDLDVEADGAEYGGISVFDQGGRKLEGRLVRLDDRVHDLLESKCGLDTDLISHVETSDWNVDVVPDADLLLAAGLP